MFVYDFKINEWIRKVDMFMERGGVVIVIVDGKIYVMGGRLNDGVVKIVEVYDLKKDLWEKLDDFFFENKVLVYRIYVEVIGKKIYVVVYENLSYVMIYSYDFEMKKW